MSKWVAIPEPAAAYLVAAALNSLHGEDEEKCCGGCCAPCGALMDLWHWELLDDLLRRYIELSGTDMVWWNPETNRVSHQYLTSRISRTCDTCAPYEPEEDAA